MKKLMSILSIIIFLWALFVGVEYFRSYRGDEKLLLTVNIETNEKYTKRTGLGFSIIDYNVPRDEIKNGTILREFYLFGIRTSKTMAIA